MITSLEPLNRSAEVMESIIQRSIIGKRASWINLAEARAKEKGANTDKNVFINAHG